MAGYVVKSPLVIVYDEAGAAHHVYAPAPVPDYCSKEQLAQLIEGGMVEKEGAAAKSDDAAPKPAARARKTAKKTAKKTAAAEPDKGDSE